MAQFIVIGKVEAGEVPVYIVSQRSRLMEANEAKGKARAVHIRPCLDS